jgi:hypothetical protein
MTEITTRMLQLKHLPMLHLAYKFRMHRYLYVVRLTRTAFARTTFARTTFAHEFLFSTPVLPTNPPRLDPLHDHRAHYPHHSHPSS